MRFLLVAAVVSLGVIGASCRAEPPAAPAEQTAPAARADDRSAASPSSGEAASGSAPRTVFTGTIAEVLNASGYTYARLTGGDSGSKDVWIATTEINATVGERVTVALDLPMRDFDSRTLNRHFELVYFVTEVARNGEPLKGPSPAAGPSLMSSHGGDDSRSSAPAVTPVDPPAGGLRVADVFARRASLSGTTVRVRGTVVKFNAGILDRNWIHLQDGSGSAAAHDNDLTLTTDASVRVGDVVSATGTVRLDQDFGAGYAYDVMIEKATIAR